MKDKDFVGHFNRLGPQSTKKELKQASLNIVNTSLLISFVSGRDRKSTAGKEELPASTKTTRRQNNWLDSSRSQFDVRIQADRMSEDLNYTLKRIVNDLVSDNHTVKREHSLHSVNVH